MQTKTSSALEGVINVALGFGIGLMGNRYVGLGFSTSFWLTTVLTIISFARGYLVRRFFNWLENQ